MLNAMNFAEADSGDGHFIEGYGHGHIVVDGRRFGESLVVSPERIIPGWGPASVEDLTEAHLAPLVELSPQVVVIGTGHRQVFPDPRLYFSLVAKGIGVEIMDTGAACRTYNILMAEGRRVAAGLIMI
jgi:uncharacterized protein